MLAFLRTLVIASLPLSLHVFVPRQLIEEPASAPARNAPAAHAWLASPVVIGASISDGFGLRAEVGSRVRLSDYLNAAIAAPHAEVECFGSAFLFQDPLARGERQVLSALERAPTLLVALDFPFWFAYGTLAREEDRPRLLEAGLALLARYDGPTLLCDLPDMSPALHGAKVLGMRMIVESQVPAPEMLKRLNAQLAAWAAERPNVTLVPMAALLDDLRADRPVVVRGAEYRKADLARLFQPDLLHASSEGTALLVALALECLAARHPELGPGLVSATPQQLSRAVIETKAVERARRAGPAESKPAGTPAGVK
ncbi:MAG: hypothetical protein FJ299_02310 [Planctomycetes bacterium]|nr:hypothetical protein [Planctomycetota bacterium]